MGYENDQESWLRFREVLPQLNFFMYSQKINVWDDIEIGEISSTDFKSASSSSEESTEVSEPFKSNYLGFYTTINILKILQKITKRKVCRLMHLIQLKTYNIFKRIVLIGNLHLQFEALKILKSQIPFLGKKWRSQNTHVVSTMYRLLASNFLDDTLSAELEIQPAESAKQELKLRELIREYHTKRYPDMFSAPEQMKDDLDLILMLSRYSSSADISLNFCPPQPAELDSHFLENYESWLDQELFSQRDDEL